MKSVLKILDKIQNESSINNKIEIIKKNKDNKLFKKVVLYALDYNKVFNISEIQKGKRFNVNVDQIFKFLDTMSSKRGATNEDKTTLSNLASIDDETIEVTNRILKKDLRCGASLKLFKEVFPEIPCFEMMTCVTDIEKFARRYKKQEETSYYWSIKKDGVRTWAINNDGEFKYISRSGLPYNNFGIYDSDIEKLSTLLNTKYKLPINTPIDGESISSGGDYTDTMKHVRTLDETSGKFTFYIFDIADSQHNFQERYNILKTIFNKNSFANLVLLEHHKLNGPVDTKKLTGIMKKIVATGEEGIVVKMGNSPYERKEKSGFWCKMKPAETYDLLVTGKYAGKKGTKYEKQLGGFIVKFKDTKVRVGSGYSDKEREDFWKSDLPKMIEINCKGITPDGSLREPRFIRVRNDKNTTTDE